MMLTYLGGDDITSAFSMLTIPLVRFLRARKFDLAKAKAMLLSAEQWRKEFGVDDITKYVYEILFV